jgi:geranylgeranylglycerol-phosphate geranylgeranyltransferase
VYIKNAMSFFELTRADHGILYAIGVIVGAVLAGWSISFSSPILFGIIAAVAIEMSTFSLNDLIDERADKANRRIDRPLVRGDADKGAALLIGVVGLALGNIAAYLVSIECFVVVLLFSIFSILYNLKLKRYPLMGNVFIAATMALPFAFGALILGSIPDSVAVLAGIAFVIGIGREIMKDVQDMVGDKAVGARTLPIVAGVKKSIYSVVICYLAGIFLSIIPAVSFFSSKPIYLAIIATDIIFIAVIAKILKNQSAAAMSFGRKWTLVASAIALVIFLAASLT